MIILKGGKLIDGSGRQPTDRSMVIIDGNLIKSVDNSEIQTENFEVINLSGMTIMPGLIDCHVHIGGYTSNNPGKAGVVFSTLEFFVDYFRSYAQRRKLAIQNGLTAIRSAGDIFPQILKLRDQTNLYRLIGPRIFASGAMFTAPGGHPVSTIYRRNRYIADSATRQSKDPESARVEVQKLAGAGVDCIKIIYSKINPLDIVQEVPRLDKVVLKEIIEESHRCDLPVMVHTGSSEEMEEAVRLGAESIEHGILPGGNVDLPDNIIEMMVDNGTSFTPTLATAWAYQSIYPDFFTGLKKLVKRLHERGVKIVCGTDSGMPGVTIGKAIHKELELLVEAGLSPMEAITAATRDAAINLGQSKNLGIVEPGKLADIVAISGDPLADITCTSKIKLVIKNGKVLLDKVQSAK